MSDKNPVAFENTRQERIARSKKTTAKVEVAQYGREVRVEQGVVAAVSATYNGQSVGADVQIGGHRRKTEIEHDGRGNSRFKDGRTSPETPGIRQNFFGRLFNPSGKDDVAAGQGLGDGSEKKDFKGKGTQTRKGNRLDTDFDTHISPSGRGGAGTLKGHTTVVDSVNKSGDRSFTLTGEGTHRAGLIKRDVRMEGSGFLAADQRKEGVLAQREFVLINKSDNKVIRVKSEVVERYFETSKGKQGNFVRFVQEQTNGAPGSLNKNYALLQVTQNPKDPSKYSYVLKDHSIGWHQHEFGKGTILINKDGDVERTRGGVRSILGFTKGVAIAWNGQAFSGKTVADTKLVSDREGNLGLAVKEVKSREGVVLVGAKVGLDGVGPFAGIMAMGATKEEAKFISKYLDRSGADVLHLQMALKKAGYYKGDLDGSARSTDGKGKNESADTLKAYIKYTQVESNTDRKLEGLIKDAARSPEGKAATAKFNGQIEAYQKDRPFHLYEGKPIVHNGKEYSVADIQKAQKKALGVDPEKTPVYDKTTVLMVNRDGKLVGIPVSEMGGRQVGGRDAAIISIDASRISFGAALPDKVPVLITTIDDNKAGKTKIGNVDLPPSFIPTGLVSPRITPPEKNDKPKNDDKKPEKDKPKTPEGQPPTKTPPTKNPPTPVPTPTPSPSPNVDNNVVSKEMLYASLQQTGLLKQAGLVAPSTEPATKQSLEAVIAQTQQSGLVAKTDNNKGANANILPVPQGPDKGIA